MNQVRIENTLQNCLNTEQIKLENNYQLLISIVLSAQTRMKIINKVTKYYSINIKIIESYLKCKIK